MNKSQLLLKAKGVLNENPIGKVFLKGSEEFDFLLKIFKEHPQFYIKRGVGIESIYINRGISYFTRCFFIKRTDGSTTDISYIQAIKGPSTKLSDIKCACRNAIKHLVDEERAKVNFGVDKCPITGDILTKENMHIDHYNKTFEEVFQTWISEENIDLAHYCLNDATKDGEQEIYFTSKYVRDGFIIHHNLNTTLRAVTRDANLSILRKTGRVK